MRNAATLGLLVGLFGCDTGARSVVVPAPEDGVVIIAAMVDSGPIFVSTWEETPLSQRSSTELSRYENFRMYRLEYDATLDELELPEGDLPIRDNGARRIPPTADLIERSEVGGSAQGPWIEFAEMPDELAALRFDLPPLSDCSELRWSKVDLPIEGTLEFSVSLDERRVLVGINNRPAPQAFFVYEANDGVTPVELTGLSTAAAYQAAHRDARGRIWLVSNQGLWRGTVEAGFTQTSSQTFDANRMKLASPDTADASDELYLWSRDRRLYRFADDTLEVLGVHTGDKSDDWFQLAWLGPNEVVAVSGRTTDFFHFKEGTLRVGSDGTTRRMSLAKTEFGLLAGSNVGLIERWSGSDWEEFTRVGNARVLTLAPLPARGLLVGGERGLFTQYFHDTEEACHETLGSVDIAHVIPIEGGAALHPNYPDSSEEQRLSVFEFADGVAR